MKPQGQIKQPVAAQIAGRLRREQLDLSGFTGLSDFEAQERFQADGPNELPTSKQRGILAIARWPGNRCLCFWSRPAACIW